MRLKKPAKKTTADVVQLPVDTLIEVVAVDSEENAYVTPMSFGAWLALAKNPKYRYSAFQYGFSSYPNAKRMNKKP